MTPEAHTEREVVVLFAGVAGSKRALRGVTPGWVRRRTSEELRAFHEAGHAVVAAFLGLFVYAVDIKIRDIGGGHAIVGVARFGDEAPPPGGVDLSEKIGGEKDLPSAIALCSLLAGTRNVKAVLGVARRLRREAERLIDLLWVEICHIASALVASGPDLPKAELDWLSQRFSGESVRPCRLPEVVSA